MRTTSWLALGQFLLLQHGDDATGEEEPSKRKEKGRDGKGLKMGLVVLVCDKRDRNKRTQINKRLI